MKKINILGASTIITFVFLTCVNIFCLIWLGNKMESGGLKILFLVNTIGLTLFVALLNIWSIIKINSITDSTKGQALCKYCASEKSGPFICNGCGSILWYNLTKPASAMAVFIAHHRWVFSASLLTIFLFYPVGYIINLKNEKEKTIENENREREIENLKIIREREKEIEISNNELIGLVSEINAIQSNIEIIELKNGILTPEFNILFEKYRNFTWRSPRLLRKLSDELLRNDSAWISAYNDYPNLNDTFSVTNLNQKFKSETSKKKQTIIIILTLLASESADLNHIQLYKDFRKVAKECVSSNSKISEKKRLGRLLRNNLSLTSTVLMGIASNQWDDDTKKHVLSLNVEKNIFKYFKNDLTKAFYYNPDFSE